MEAQSNKNNNNTEMTYDDNQEEKLPEVLEKLKIDTLMPTIKLRDDDCLPLLLNPFYFHDKTATKSSDDQIVKKLFGNKCNCILARRNSNNHLNNSIERNIINPTRFKHKRNTLRRVHLKESLLKTIRNCCIHHHNNNMMVVTTNQNDNDTVNSDIANEFSDYPTLEDLRLEDDNISSKTSKLLKPIRAFDRNPLNFRILIKNYNNPIASSSLYLPPSLSKFTGQFRNFTTLQSSDDRLSSATRRMLTLTTTSNNNNDDGTLNVSTNINNIISSSSTSSSSSSSSSCSQQARNNSPSTSTASSTAATTAVSCDITIDELACYFETFVHIPKKMSSMAEMMYI